MQGPGSCYSSYWLISIDVIDILRVSGVINVLRLLQFERESGFTEITMKMDEVATGFNGRRRIFGDFNAQFALIECLIIAMPAPAWLRVLLPSVYMFIWDCFG